MPFSRVIGNERLVALLKQALKTGRLSHAYLFHGPELWCLRQAAHALVEALFCGREEGCGTCPSCIKVSTLQHPDLHLLEPDGSFIKIDQIRSLQRELAFRPFEAQKKVCIIEGAEMMNPAAANAFLKTLEEPPGEALLILLTTHREGILPTILSRCQILQFSPLPSAVIIQELEREGAPPDQARTATALASGSLERARDLLAGDLLPVRHALLEQVVDLSKTGVTPLFAAAERNAADKGSAAALVAMLRLFWRDILLVKAGHAEIANIDLAPLVERTSRRYNFEQVMNKLEAINRAGHALTRNANPRLTLEVLFMELGDFRRRVANLP